MSAARPSGCSGSGSFGLDCSLERFRFADKWFFLRWFSSAKIGCSPTVSGSSRRFSLHDLPLRIVAPDHEISGGDRRCSRTGSLHFSFKRNHQTARNLSDRKSCRSGEATSLDEPKRRIRAVDRSKRFQPRHRRSLNDFFQKISRPFGYFLFFV